MSRRSSWFTLAVTLSLVSLVFFAPTASADHGGDDHDDAAFLIVGSQTSSGIGLVRVRADQDNNGTYEKLVGEFAPYSAAVSGGVRVAAGDFDGDGNTEVATATGNTAPVKVFTIGADGGFAGQAMAKTGFPKGAFVAAGDVNGDGNDELVTGEGAGRPPRVMIFSDTNGDGIPAELTNNFLAYPSGKTGGVRVALGDTDADGRDEVITGLGAGTGPVKVWNDADGDRQVSDDAINESFFPYGGAWAGGVFLASGESDVGSGDVIAIAPNAGKKPVRIYVDTDNDDDVSDNGVFDALNPYGTAHSTGIRLALGDTDHSGTFNELVTVPGAAAGTKPLKIFDDDGTSGADWSTGTLDYQVKAFPASVSQGAFVAVGFVTRQVYSLPAAVFIPDPGTVVAEINVPPSAGLIRNLNVMLGIQHTFDEDLDVTLTHRGVSVVLFTDVGHNDDGFIVTLTDFAGADIGAAPDDPNDRAVAGFFDPEGAAVLSAFNGQDASGLWQLTVTDDFGADSGLVHSWDLVVTY